jgi:hypothetical protein
MSLSDQPTPSVGRIARGALRGVELALADASKAFQDATTKLNKAFDALDELRSRIDVKGHEGARKTAAPAPAEWKKLLASCLNIARQHRKAGQPWRFVAWDLNNRGLPTRTGRRWTKDSARCSLGSKL